MVSTTKPYPGTPRWPPPWISRPPTPDSCRSLRRATYPPLLHHQRGHDPLGLSDLAGAALSECRRGKNTRHLLTGLLRQSVFGRLAGYEDVNDAERLAHDPAMRAVVDRTGLDRQAASTSQMGRFETAWLTSEANLAALADLSGAWIDRVHARRPQTTIVLDMDSSVSETHGVQEGSAYNGHFGCTCYHPLFVFNQFGDLERCSLRSATPTAPPTGATCWNRWWRVTGAR